MKHFLRLAAGLVLAASLGACAQLQSFGQNIETAWTVVTTASQVEITPTTVSELGNGFDIAQAGGTSYLAYCRTSKSTAQVCAQGNKDVVVRSIYSGRVARNRLERCVKAGTCSAKAADDFSALKAAKDAITAIVNLWKGY